MWDAIKEYYIMLGEEYSVNPIVFLVIHVLATPPFLFCVAWLIKNIKKHKSILLPILFTVFFFNAANIYLVFAGKNIPFWIYSVVALMTLISGYFTYKKIKKKIAA
jgi:uncharacterized membrane protein